MKSSLKKKKKNFDEVIRNCFGIGQIRELNVIVTCDWT